LPIPIVMTTFVGEKNSEKRLKYFKASISSLERSNADLTNLYIFDDYSIYPNQLDFLITLKEKYKVYSRHHNYGTMLHTVSAITQAFKENPKEKYIAFLQDDILLNRNWLKDGIRILESVDSSKKIAYINLCDRQGKKNNSDKEYVIMEYKHAGGIAWIIKSSFWKEYINKWGVGNGEEILNNNQKNDKKACKHLFDWKVTRHANGMGYSIAVVKNRSLVQHIGDNSSLHFEPMERWRSENFIGE